MRKVKIIEVKNLNKEFKVKEKEKGIKGSIKSIFKPKYKTIKAVNNINFSVDRKSTRLNSSHVAISYAVFCLKKKKKKKKIQKTIKKINEQT